MSMSVSLSVCSRNWKTTQQNFTRFVVMLLTIMHDYTTLLLYAFSRYARLTRPSNSLTHRQTLYVRQLYRN